jgi:hypothetical protein
LLFALLSGFWHRNQTSGVCGKEGGGQRVNSRFFLAHSALSLFHLRFCITLLCSVLDWRRQHESAKSAKKARVPTSGHLYLSVALLAIAIGFEMSPPKKRD